MLSASRVERAAVTKAAPFVWTRRHLLLLATFVACTPLLLPSQQVGADTLAIRESSASAQYTSESLRQLLRRASDGNKYPASLASYTANVETEITLIIRRADGTEIVGAVEQVASTLQWSRAGIYEQRVQGHRMQQTGASVSMLSVFQTGWLNATLYGNQLRTRQPPTAEDSGRRATEQSSGGGNAQRANRDIRGPVDSTAVVHPLAEDRERWYRYSGGDTLVTLRPTGRSIPIVRVEVIPREDLAAPAVLFRGEMHLDASRGTLVRLRGGFVRTGPERQSGGMIARLAGKLVQAIAFIDYENAEREGDYWLPSTQRIELQASAPPIADARAVVRVVSRFADMRVNAVPANLAVLSPVDSARVRVRGTRRRMSFAPPDSLAAFTSWANAFGTLSKGLHSDDFDAFGPERWRTVGAPRFDWGTPQGPDLLRYNRVEGLFTGFGGKLAFRDLSPGTVVRATAGYAWGDQSVRGRVELYRDRGDWRVMLRAGRSLDLTNDFRNPMDSGSALASIVGPDEYDYVDRRFVGAQLERTIGAREWQWRLESGFAHDGAMQTQYASSPIGGFAFRPNRGVDEGSYLRNAFTLNWRPDASAEFIRPGMSGRAYVEQGIGALDYTRAELRVGMRQQYGPFTAVSRADVGALVGPSLPSQQLFELGRSQGLPGYEYKNFAGSRAAVVRGLLLYSGPFFRQPIRVGRAVVLPAFAPGASIGVQTGMTSAPSEGARASILRLGLAPDSLGTLRAVSRVSDGWRSSVSAGFRFFSGSLFVGGAQPLERGGKWRWLFTVGQQL